MSILVDAPTPKSLLDRGSLSIADAAAPTVTFTKPRPGGRTNPTTEYSKLLNVVRDAGLLRKRTGFYYFVFSMLTLALAAR